MGSKHHALKQGHEKAPGGNNRNQADPRKYSKHGNPPSENRGTNLLLYVIVVDGFFVELMSELVFDQYKTEQAWVKKREREVCVG